MYELDKDKKWVADNTFGNAKWYDLQLGLYPVSMHLLMFSVIIDLMATDEQKEQWMPKINNLNILGCYAQTEIGHGSDVQGLETTATFDPKTDEFVIHTPSMTATKWWPGEMGGTANYAVVFA